MIKKISCFFIATTFLFASSDAELKEELKKAQQEKAEINAKISSIKSELLKRKLDRSFITHTEFGYSKTSGNTDTENYNLEMNIKKNWGKHHASLLFDAHYAKDNEVESKNKYLLELNYNYDFNSKLAFDYLFGYKDDKFSGYDYQLYTGPGIKYEVFKNEKHSLESDANVLYSEDKSNDPLVGVDDYISYRLKGDYTWKIIDNLKFNQVLSYRSEFSEVENYFVFSKSALSVSITELVSAGLSYKIDYVNLPTAGSQRVDDTISANLIVDY